MSNNVGEARARPTSVRKGAGFRAHIRGQALILSVVCLLVFCIGVLVLFNTGQVVNKKVQLTNTADAAAYSAAVQQARALNLIAYLNRAQVANEVSVAQMVSMHSWMNYMISGTSTLKNAAQTVGIVADITVVLAELGAALQEVATGLGELKDGMIAARNLMQGAFTIGVTALSVANEAYSGATFLVAESQALDIPNVVNSVIKANTTPVPGGTDKEAKLSALALGVLTTQAETATRQYIKTYQVPAALGGRVKRTADADRYSNVVMEARDGFSRERNSHPDLSFNIPFILNFFLGKRGGTDLVDYNRWVGMDSLSLKFEAGPCVLFGACKKVDLAMAYGGAAATLQANAKFSSLASPGINNGAGWTSPYDLDSHAHVARYNGAMDNNAAGKEALSNPALPNARSAILGGYLGLHSYEDIAANKAVVPYDATGKQDVGPIFSVLVEQQMSDVRTSSNVNGIGGPPDIQAPDAAQNQAMTALASAQTYFSRPRGLDSAPDRPAPRTGQPVQPVLAGTSGRYA